MDQHDPEMENLEAALKIYNTRYDNSVYLQLNHAVAYFLNDSLSDKPATDQPKVVDFMNQVINATLDICGSTFFAGGKRLLAFQIAYHEMPDRLYSQVEDYLRPFADPDSCDITDFRAAYCTFRDALEAQNLIEQAQRETSSIHGWQGQLAHNLLFSAFNCILAACTILNSLDNNARSRLLYARQKMNIAAHNLENAFEVGQLLSNEPDVFDPAPVHQLSEN